jgi:hypothetical protein
MPLRVIARRWLPYPSGQMRQYKKDIYIFIGLVTLTFVLWLLTLGQSTIDIQLHDTYFVLDKVSMIVLILGPLTFSIFLARGLTRKFKSFSANTGLIIGLILIALITYRIIELEKSYLNQVKGLDDNGLPDRVVDIESKIKWTWGLFSLWIGGIILLTVQTIKIREEGYGSQHEL